MSRCAYCGMNRVPTPHIHDNRPGLDVLRYRVGTHASFFQTMKDHLSSARYPGLENLLTRESRDFSLALLDAWAVIGDVLTFYQERIANEGYLRTCTEKQSIVELARLVDYRLQPGVAASVYAAYVLEQDAVTMIPARSRMQSVPAAEEIPQTFETSTKLVARAAWNKLRPRLTKPSVISAETTALYLKGTSHNLEPNSPVLMLVSQKDEASPPSPVIKHIEKVETEFELNRTRLILQNLSSNPAVPANPQSTFKTLQAMVEPLSKSPAGHPSNPFHLPRQASKVYSSNSEIVPRLLKELYPGLQYSLSQALSDAVIVPKGTSQALIFRARNAPFGHNAPLKPITDPITGRVVGSEDWALAGTVVFGIELNPMTSHTSGGGVLHGTMNAVISIARGVQRWKHSFSLTPLERSENSLIDRFTVGNTQVTVKFDRAEQEDEQEETLQFVFDNPTKTIFFRSISGDLILRVQVDEEPEIPLSIGESIQTHIGLMNEQQVVLDYGHVQPGGSRILAEVTAPLSPDPSQLTLDVENNKIAPGSWVVVERPGTPSTISKIKEVHHISMNDYGLSGRVTQVTLEKTWLDPSTDVSLGTVRNSTVYAQSEVLEIADEPVEEPVQGVRITVDGYFPELEAGRWLIVEGSRIDVPNTTNIPGRELVMLSGVEHDVGRIPQEPVQPEEAEGIQPGSDETISSVPLPGDSIHTTLILAQPLSYIYQRDTVSIYANVVHATNGETRAQILGSADASRPFQRFTLQQGPLTFVSTPSEEGAKSTLEVRVNNMKWDEVSNLVLQGAEDRVFMVQQSAEGPTSILFGNGIHGLRPTTGIENVSASFRIGIGKGGNVAPKQISVALDRPLGVREVINPLPATGGSDPEGLSSARSNVSRGLKTLGRVVSIADYEHFACSFAGVGKAKAASMRNGQGEVLHVTIAGVEDAPIDEQSDVFQNLLRALTRFGDPHHVVHLGIRERLLVVLKAHVRLFPEYLWEAVAPRLRAALLKALSFENRNLGEPLYLSHILQLLQSHEGVQNVQVEIFDVLTRDFTDESLEKLRQLKKPRQIIPVHHASLTKKGSSVRPAQIAYLSPEIPDTLILTLMD